MISNASANTILQPVRICGNSEDELQTTSIRAHHVPADAPKRAQAHGSIYCAIQNRRSHKASEFASGDTLAWQLRSTL